MKYFLFRLVSFLVILFINLYISVLLGNIVCDLHDKHTFLQYVWMTPFYLFAYYFYKLLSRRMVTTNEVLLILKANFLSLVAIFFIVAIGRLNDQISRSLMSHLQIQTIANS